MSPLRVVTNEDGSACIPRQVRDPAAVEGGRWPFRETVTSLSDMRLITVGAERRDKISMFSRIEPRKSCGDILPKAHTLLSSSCSVQVPLAWCATPVREFLYSIGPR